MTLNLGLNLNAAKPFVPFDPSFMSSCLVSYQQLLWNPCVHLRGNQCIFWHPYWNVQIERLP